MISFMTAFIERYGYLYFYAAAVAAILVCGMMIAWIIAIKVRENGTVYIKKHGWFYKFRCVIVTPIALFLNLKILINSDYDIADYKKYVIETIEEYAIVDSLCKIFWNSIISVVVLIPVNIFLYACLVVGFCIVAPFVMIFFGIRFLFKKITDWWEKRAMLARKAEQEQRLAKHQKSAEKFINDLANNRTFTLEEMLINWSGYYLNQALQTLPINIDNYFNYNINFIRYVRELLKEVYNEYDLDCDPTKDHIEDLDVIRDIVTKAKKNNNKLTPSDKKTIKQFIEKYKIIDILTKKQTLIKAEESRREQIRKSDELAKREFDRKKEMLIKWYRNWLCPKIVVIDSDK